MPLSCIEAATRSFDHKAVGRGQLDDGFLMHRVTHVKDTYSPLLVTDTINRDDSLNLCHTHAISFGIPILGMHVVPYLGYAPMVPIWGHTL